MAPARRETRFIIGIDIGGTKISVCTATTGGRVVFKEVTPAEPQKSPSYALSKIKAMVHHAFSRNHLRHSQVMGIGIGCVGPIDPEKGLVLSPPNLPGWDRVPLKKYLQDEFDFRVVMDNDANCAGLAEKMFGAGTTVSDLFYFTVSTGIGGGVIIDGKIYRGASFDAGEVGHSTILPDGPVCNCGKRGCLEALASGTAIARIARERVRSQPESEIIKLVEGKTDMITAQVVLRAARLGDKLAGDIWKESGTYLGIGVSNVIQILNPEMAVLGGSVTKAGRLLFDPLRTVAAKYTWQRAFRRCKIVRARLGNNVGDLGAISLLLQKE
jgi:glucokinase